MKLDSKYFDCVRVKPTTKRPWSSRHPSASGRAASRAGLHRAPKGRGREGQYYLLCLDHVRQFNASYNYFDGMSNAEVEAYQKDSVIGHRPTWKAGANAWAHGTRHGWRQGGLGRGRRTTRMRFSVWRAGRIATATNAAPAAQAAGTQVAGSARTGRRRRPGCEIKARFKELVKRHHPDANGGDKRSEDKLREIIQAYNYLKQAGLV